jgi:hypothetical protein
MGDLQGFASALQGGKIIPKDAFAHAFTMMDYSTSEEVRLFSNILEKHILLANLGNDKIRLYQNDIVLLTHLFDMVQRESGLYGLFKQLYYGWKGELAITRAKDGKERLLQATAGKGYQARDAPLGYSDLIAELDRQEQNIFQKFAEKFSGGNRQPQGGGA